MSRLLKAGEKVLLLDVKRRRYLVNLVNDHYLVTRVDDNAGKGFSISPNKR